MNPETTPGITTVLKMKVEEFFNEERFSRCGVRYKFTRARILHFLESQRILTIEAIVKASARFDLSLGRDFGKTSYSAMVKILESEGIQLNKHDKPQRSRSWKKDSDRLQQWYTLSTQ